jgi:hypothetical protein
MADLLIGLDLGKTSDFTALVVVKRSLARDAAGSIVRDARGLPAYTFSCNHINRFELGTPYTTIVAEVSDLVRRSEFVVPPVLAVDATGVGSAVVDLFLDARLHARVVPVTITGGSAEARWDRWCKTGVRGFWVPKTELVSAIHAGLGTRRLGISGRIEHAVTLQRELIDFQVRVTAAAHETFSAREGMHDDLVLALAIAVWLGSRREVLYERPDPAEAEALQADAARRKQEDEEARRKVDEEYQRKWLSIGTDQLFIPL